MGSRRGLRGRMGGNLARLGRDGLLGLAELIDPLAAFDARPHAIELVASLA